MRRDTIIDSINVLCEESNDFRRNVSELVRLIGQLSNDELVKSLLECGVIPESFEHSLSNEKLYAKYCDVLLAEAFSKVGIPATVLDLRGDSADVAGAAEGYTIVGDAKAFRLSRTARNPKDFKVAALSGWRGDNDYACLAGPLYQYPSSRSQIYTQAVDNNVTLLGFVHLAFLVKYSRQEPVELSPLWTVGERAARSGSASDYWRNIDETTCQVIGQDIELLDNLKEFEAATLEQLKVTEAEHIQLRIDAIRSLTKEEVTEELIRVLNLPDRVSQIRRVSY